MLSTTTIGLRAETGANGLAGRRRQTQKNCPTPLASAAAVGGLPVRRVLGYVVFTVPLVWGGKTPAGRVVEAGRGDAVTVKSTGSQGCAIVKLLGAVSAGGELSVFVVPELGKSRMLLPMTVK